ncbi:MAG: tetratricopeptide repeat protein [Deltaproteobacteria bacterium]|nr:tetratricopeptide repeat protein [Deltaproteobacteria bacterium]
MATIKKLKKKKSRKDVLKPDEFLTKSKDVFDIITEHWRPVTISFLTAIVLVIVSISWRSCTVGQDEKATMALGDVMKTLDAPVVPEGSKPPKGPDGKTVKLFFPDETSKNKEAEKQLVKLEDDFSGTDLAKSSKLLLANIQVRLNDLDSAIETYKSFLDNPVDVPYMRFLAIQDLAYTYEQKKDLDSALNQFQKLAAEMEKNPLQDEGLFQVGRIQELRGDKEAAKTAYTQLVENFPNSNRKKEAEVRLIELKAKPGADKTGKPIEKTGPESPKPEPKTKTGDK